MGRLRTNAKAPEQIKKFQNFCNLETFIFPDKPIYLEIGCGKGDFLIENALKNPNVFFLGIEKYSTVILKALKKIQRNNLKLKNLAFACVDAKEINADKFKNTISKLYLNFSDPWPKKRHEKRRLTSSFFLNLYKKILINNTFVEFKTDNNNLYIYTLEMLKSRGDTQLIYWTNNLYFDLKNKNNYNNTQTEYEKKFVKMNKNIHKIIWKYL